MRALDLLLHHLDTAYDRKSWHGPTLKGALRGVAELLAAWRPAPGRHTIWELTLHCAYWKYTVRRRILDERRNAFPLVGSNWFPRPDGAATWAHERPVLGREHIALRAAVASLDETALARKSASFTLAELIMGAADHDLYHAGQIQLMKRLAAQDGLDVYEG